MDARSDVPFVMMDVPVGQSEPWLVRPRSNQVQLIPARDDRVDSTHSTLLLSDLGVLDGVARSSRRRAARSNERNANPVVLLLPLALASVMAQMKLSAATMAETDEDVTDGSGWLTASPHFVDLSATPSLWSGSTFDTGVPANISALPLGGTHRYVFGVLPSDSGNILATIHTPPPSLSNRKVARVMPVNNMDRWDPMRDVNAEAGFGYRPPTGLFVAAYQDAGSSRSER